MSHNPDMPLTATESPKVTTCLNCHSAMPSELRFCRNCGFRLGEGVAEYTETVRFDGSQVPAPAVAAGLPHKRRRKISGMTWIFIALLAFFVCAAAFTAIITPFRPNVRVSAPVAPRSFVGVNSFETTDGGVTFDNVDVPGGPAYKAGLVGGDIITSFDGRQVQEDDELSDLVRQTPIGKTVEVVYLRDGETKTTQLTTVSREEFDRLRREFESRPGGGAFFGFSEGSAERVEIPGTKLFGVKLNRIYPSRPADLAGIKEGDIVIEFDGVPIRTAREFRVRVLWATPYSTVKVVVMRDGEKLEIPVKMGRNN